MGIVYGQRRQGKSYLLRRLTRSYDGLYFMAVEEDRALALERFGRALGKATGIDAPVKPDNWEQALDLGLRAPGGEGRGRLLVLDELPYLLRHSPELPSLVQTLVDEGAHTASAGAKLILCRAWIRTFSSTDTWGRPPGEVGKATLDDTSGKAQLELDALALADGQRRQPRKPDIVVIGEAKHTRKPRTPADVERLDHARGLLEARGARTSDARLAVFGASGFSNELVALARRRSDVVLVDLDRLYSGD